MYTMEQYMSKEVSHQEYYYALAQNVLGPHPERIFDPKWVKAIKASTDEHLNDISLARWDRFPSPTFFRLNDKGQRLTSPSMKVCCLKAIARNIRGF